MNPSPFRLGKTLVITLNGGRAEWDIIATGPDWIDVEDKWANYGPFRLEKKDLEEGLTKGEVHVE